MMYTRVNPPSLVVPNRAVARRIFTLDAIIGAFRSETAMPRHAASSAQPVYASVDAVSVPDGVAPGEHFTARLWANQRGERVPRSKNIWRASGNVAVVVHEQAATLNVPRHSQRPSALARRKAGAGAQAIDHLEFAQCSVTQWKSEIEMPTELHADDVGWLPGPVNGSTGRAMPAFTGQPSGPRDPSLTSRSSARQIMRSVQFSRSFKQHVLKLTREHQQCWAAEHAVADSIERSFRPVDLQQVHVELWFALALRVAKLNPAIAADKLWDSTHHCFDAEVSRACSHTQWQWLNRHLSFGSMRQSNAEGDSSEEGEGGDDSDGSSSGGDADQSARADRHRSRRVVSDIARAQAAKAYRPGQHLGFDDLIRVTRHSDGRRVRHKAAVHTGRANDGLNDAQSHYFLWWEEQGWLRADAGGSAGDTIPNQTASSAAAATTQNHQPVTQQQAGSRGGRSGNGGGGVGVGSGNDGGGGSGGGSGSGSQADVHADSEAVNDDAASAADEPGDESGDSSTRSVTSIKARVQRACSVLRPHVGHCLWLDRGMASLDALRWASESGFYISAVMQANRIGLPRRLIALLKKSMTCSKSCTHSQSSSACKRWCWTVLHKGQWELELWCDGSELVIFLSNCTSATRMMTLSRSVGRQIRQPLCPGGIAQYNIYGRGPTDTGDQQRRRLSLSNRRRLRQGTKGALFDGEIGFVNGNIIAERLRARSVTVWEFADEYSAEVLAAVSMRRTSPNAAAQQSGGTRAQRDAHRLVSFREERRSSKREGKLVGTRAKRGRECCDAASGRCPEGEGRPAYFCAGCKREREGCSGWYHWDCYWKRHRSVCV